MGFDHGEKAIHIVESANREEYLNRLAEAGINVQEVMEAGRLEVLPWTGTWRVPRGECGQSVLRVSAGKGMGRFQRLLFCANFEGSSSRLDLHSRFQVLGLLREQHQGLSI
jgi:hypothetical protein